MIAGRTQQISPFLAMEVLEAAQEIDPTDTEVIHLEVGEPDFPTPEPIKDAALRAIRENRTRYTHSMGLLPLREAIAEHFHRTYGVSIAPDQILVTAGTSPALLLICLALCEPGDEVILTDPCYACYPNFVRVAGAQPVFVPIYEEEGFQLTAEAVRRHLTLVRPRLRLGKTGKCPLKCTVALCDRGLQPLEVLTRDDLVPARDNPLKNSQEDVRFLLLEGPPQQGPDLLFFLVCEIGGHPVNASLLSHPAKILKWILAGAPTRGKLQ